MAAWLRFEYVSGLAPLRPFFLTVLGVAANRLHIARRSFHEDRQQTVLV